MSWWSSRGLAGVCCGFVGGLLLSCVSAAEADDDVCRSFDEQLCIEETECATIRGTEVLGDCKRESAFADCMDFLGCAGPLEPHRDEVGICWLVPRDCMSDAFGWNLDRSCPELDEIADLPTCD